jgi:AcrR family transcriptional regulator
VDEVPTVTARHEELLDQLVELFLAEGFAAFTLGDLTVRLRCSKSTLYALGHSKEAVTVNVLKRFFRRAADRVEARTAAAPDPAARLVAYLRAVADELRAAGPQFLRDLAANPATRAAYEANTAMAAERVRQLVAEGSASGDFRGVNGPFVADVVASVMVRIQSGDVRRAVGLHDADAYDELAALVLSGILSDTGAAPSALPASARRRTASTDTPTTKRTRS